MTYWIGKFANNVLDLLAFLLRYPQVSGVLSTPTPLPPCFLLLSGEACPGPVLLSAPVVFPILRFKWQTSLLCFVLFVCLYTKGMSSCFGFIIVKVIFWTPLASLFYSEPRVGHRAFICWVSSEPNALHRLFLLKFARYSLVSTEQCTDLCILPLISLHPAYSLNYFDSDFLLLTIPQWC